MRANHSEALTQRSIELRHPHKTSADSLQTINHEELTASFNSAGPPLTANDVLLTVPYGLMYTARFPNNQKVESFKILLQSLYNMQIEVIGIAAASTAVEPFLKYRSIVMALSQMLQYMLQQRRFSGVL